MLHRPAVSKHGLREIQVCVPADWPDDAVRGFAEGRNPSKTPRGWEIRPGATYREPCPSRDGMVHVTLDA